MSTENAKPSTPVHAHCYLLAAYMKHMGGIGAISTRRYQMALELIANDIGRDKVDDVFLAEVRELERSLPCPLD